MNGISRTFYAVLAVFLRLIARVPLGAGEAISTCARWCEERATASAKLEKTVKG